MSCSVCGGGAADHAVCVAGVAAPDSQRPWVVIHPHPRTEGFEGPGAKPFDILAPAPLEVALGVEWATDAHFSCYHLRTAAGELVLDPPRVNKPGLPQLGDLELRFGSVALDIDNEAAHHGKIPEAPASWFGEVLEALGASPVAELPGLLWYRTRGGLRLIWQLEADIGPDAYEALCSRLLHFVRRHLPDGARGDALTDWTRLFRLPNVVRDGEQLRYGWARLTEGLLDPSTVPEAPAGKQKRFEGLSDAAKQLPSMIPDGRRTITLLKAAGAMNRAGFSEAAIYAALEVENEARCSPPMDAHELERVAASAAGYATEDDAFAPPGTRIEHGSHNELADYVLRQLEDEGPRTYFCRGHLWRYQPDLGIWRPVSDAVISSLLAELDGLQVYRGRLKIDEGKFSGTLAFLARKRTAEDWLDNPEPSVVFKNGTVDASGRLGPHRAELKATHRLEVDYNPEARSPTLERVLSFAFEDSVDEPALLQQFAGAALLGVARYYQRALMLYGEGANGKSVLLAGIRALFPEGSVTAVPPQDFGQEYRRDLLATARANIVAEVPEDRFPAPEAFRAVVDGTPLVARRIQGSPYTFRANAAQIFAANNLPGSRDFSDAFWRRWLVVPFERVVPEEARIPGLEDTIGDELQGLAAWAVQGFRQLQQQGGYTIGKASTHALRVWRCGADQVALFAGECADGGWTAASRLYGAYRLWCGSTGQKAITLQAFGRRLRQLQIEQRRTKYGVEYRLVPERTSFRG